MKVFGFGKSPLPGRPDLPKRSKSGKKLWLAPDSSYKKTSRWPIDKLRRNSPQSLPLRGGHTTCSGATKYREETAKHVCHYWDCCCYRLRHRRLHHVGPDTRAVWSP